MPRMQASTNVRLRALREARGDSRERVAVDLDVSLDTIRRWEQDGPPMHRINDVASHFKVSPAYLMGWEREAA